MKTFNRLLVLSSLLLCSCSGPSPRPSDISSYEPTSIIDTFAVILDQSEVSLYVGESVTLSARAVGGNGVDSFIYSSNDEEVAIIEGYRIKAIGAGECIVTVTAISGELTATAECSVTVYEEGQDDSSEPQEQQDDLLFDHIVELADNTDKTPLIDEVYGIKSNSETQDRLISKGKRDSSNDLIDITYPDHVREGYENDGVSFTRAYSAGLLFSENNIPFIISTKDMLMDRISQLNTWIINDEAMSHPGSEDSIACFRGSYDEYFDELVLEDYVKYPEDNGEYSQRYERISSSYDNNGYINISCLVKENNMLSFFVYKENKLWEYSKIQYNPNGDLQGVRFLSADLTERGSVKCLTLGNNISSQDIYYEESKMINGNIYCYQVHKIIYDPGTENEKVYNPTGVTITALNSQNEFISQFAIDIDAFDNSKYQVPSPICLNAYKIGGYDNLFAQRIVPDQDVHRLYFYRDGSPLDVSSIGELSSMTIAFDIRNYTPRFNMRAQCDNGQPVPNDSYEGFISYVVSQLNTVGLSIDPEFTVAVRDGEVGLREFLSPRLSVLPSVRNFSSEQAINVVKEHLVDVDDQYLASIKDNDMIHEYDQIQDESPWIQFAKPKMSGLAHYNKDNHSISLNNVEFELATSAVLKQDHEYGIQLVLDSGSNKQELQTIIKTFNSENLEDGALRYKGFDEISLEEISDYIDFDTIVSLKAYLVVDGVIKSVAYDIGFDITTTDEVLFSEKTTNTPLTDFYSKDYLNVEVDTSGIIFMRGFASSRVDHDPTITTDYSGSIGVNEYGFFRFSEENESLVLETDIADGIQGLYLKLTYVDQDGVTRVAYISNNMLGSGEAIVNGEDNTITINLNVISLTIAQLIEAGVTIASNFTISITQVIYVYNEDGEAIDIYTSDTDFTPITLNIEEFETFSYDEESYYVFFINNTIVIRENILI